MLIALFHWRLAEKENSVGVYCYGKFHYAQPKQFSIVLHAFAYPVHLHYDPLATTFNAIFNPFRIARAARSNMCNPNDDYYQSMCFCSINSVDFHLPERPFQHYS